MARARTEPAAAPEGEEASAADEPTEGSLPTVVQALSRVMGDVQSISKNSRTQQGNQSFNFRGIDAVMNAVGPALREHGVVVVPIGTSYEFEHYESRNGARMKGVTLTVTFRFYGPAGDFIEAQATGESSDAGDKAMPKAHSVAFRTLLLQALCIPTDEPDPDSYVHERASVPFEGSSGNERAARPRQTQRPQDTYNYPKDWTELARRMGELLGRDEAPFWMKQAVEVTVGSQARIPELPEADQRAAWDVLTKALRSLDEEAKVDPNAFPPPTRDVIAGEFAKHLDGVILAGPPWALSSEEAEAGMLSKEVWDGAAVMDDTETEKPTDEPSPKPTEATPEPTEEEIEEQQRLLDEEAAAAAEYDREQFRDRAGDY